MIVKYINEEVQPRDAATFFVCIAKTRGVYWPSVYTRALQKTNTHELNGGTKITTFQFL